MSDCHDMYPPAETLNLELLIAFQAEIQRCRVLISEIQDPELAASYRRQIDELEQMIRIADAL